ncbi:DUF3150 domain-containing protein [Chitinophaga cymbidii]|uniref:Uncharacterized protein n=1 Tax=Chitinophaga cymbidii TaxID=1096750 RepID=A0A512RFJ3_9BACT|nr:DUF3150 domain-containing protein [Chitinophaga cymbidii]GEP94487.1 hypothetical protein CCY01nite_07470 [Chitinophaga cymbidii]
MKSLPEKALLVNLTISQWCARKYDRKVSQKIEEAHNTRNAGRFNKILIAENELKEIQKIAGAARSFLYENTLPWGDNGDRLLPATNYFEFIAKYNDFKYQFHSAVDSFITQYPHLKEDARQRLNGMFQESDYPPISDVRTKFAIQISFMTISDTTDFRLEIDQKEISVLKHQIETELNTRISQATRNIWVRIREAVGHMVEKLSEQKAIFRDSLVANISELIDILPRLNFTQDENVMETIESMKHLLIDPELLRNDDLLRSKKALEAKQILDKVNEFFA